jgi:hypothetical protein
MKKNINRILLIFTFLLLSSCRTPNANQTIVYATPYGSSVEKVCGAKNINYKEKREFPSSGYGPEIELCTKDSYVEYNESKKTMIVVGKNSKAQNAGGYFVFENVSKPLNCNFLFCIYGDGKFKHAAVTLDEARRYADPELLAGYEKEQAKIRKEEERLAKIKEKEEESRLAKEKLDCGSKINLDWSWKFDKYKYYAEYTFKSKSNKAIEITSVSLFSGENKIFESDQNVLLRPYTVGYANIRINNLNIDLINTGGFRCKWSSDVSKSNSNPIYTPQKESSSGSKDLLKKIIGQ